MPVVASSHFPFMYSQIDSMTAPPEVPGPTPIRIRAHRLTKWLRDTRLVHDNPFIEKGQRLYISARDQQRGRWYETMTQAVIREIHIWLETLLPAIERTETALQLKRDVVPRIEGIEREIREWIGWETFRELESSAWLPFPLCSLQTKRAVTALIHQHYETGLPERLTSEERLLEILRTSEVTGRFAWKRLLAQWRRLPWPLVQIEVPPVLSTVGSFKKEVGLR